VTLERPHSVTKTDAAFRTLRQAIEDGRYHPGEHLRVQRLVEELQMSPTPIREALRLLQSEGLVVHHPHRGTAVAEFSPDDAIEVYRLRLVLEPMAAELAAQRATPEELAVLRSRHDELGAAIAGTHRTDAAELNMLWHRAVVSASGSRYIVEFVTRLWQALPGRAIWLTSRAAMSYGQHERVTVAIESGDAAAAYACMREHIELGATSTIEHMRAVGHAGPP
jgi:DNA-binding GntR family transcriptional regulator